MDAEGKFYTTVIAYNKALMTSRPVCSDGFVRDVTPPAFRNVTIRGAGTRERIACLGSDVFLLQRNASLVQLDPAACTGRCRASSETSWLAVLPVTQRYGYNESATSCQRLKELSWTESVLYLPNDNIFLGWDLEEGESQIQETQVAFGTSLSGPDLEDFRATLSSRRYQRNHEGLPTATPLFLFLRAANKAGLAADVTLGPLVVDETPPRVRRSFSVSTSSSAASLLLQPSDFLDSEDLSTLDVTVHLGAVGGRTPLPASHLVLPEACPEGAEAGSRCHGVSLASLRRLAGEEARDFFFLAEIRDLAGHQTTAQSATFRVPSLLPPGQGRVFDLDPESPEPGEDVDFQRNLSQACVGWDGFRTQEDVSISVGLGTAAGMDDVKTFSPAQNDSTQICLRDLHLQPHVRYVATVKAVSLAGATLVSSDGFTVLDASSFPALQVWDGRGCRGKEAVSLEVLPGGGGDSESTAAAGNLHPGKTYTLLSDGGADFSVTSPDVVWLSSSQSSAPGTKPFLALSHSASFLSDVPSASLNVLECVEDEDFSSDRSLSALWNFTTKQSLSPSHFLVSLLENKCSGADPVDKCMDTVIEFENVGNVFDHVFPEVSLTPDSTYHVAVRPCLGHLCGDSSLSDGLQFQPHPASTAPVTLSMADAGSSCPGRLSLRWQPFHCGGAMTAPYYHVTLTEVDELSGEQTVFLSRGLTVSNESEHSVESDCHGNQLGSSSGVRGCVRGGCPSGQEATSCHWLTPDPAPTPLYDLDAGKGSPRDVIGRHGDEASDARAARLREEDVDFVRSSVTLAGAIDRDWEGGVDWFLLAGTEAAVEECSQAAGCLHHIRTSGNTVEFPEMTLQDGQRYYICARRSAAAGGSHGNQTGALLCSDGFLVDDVPPSPPELRVANAVEGFLRSPSTLHLQWGDVIDLDLSGREAGASGIASVAFSLGTREGGTDVHPLTTSQASSVLLQNLNLTSGMTCYANLKATDRAGLTRDVSRKFVVDTTAPTLGHVTTAEKEGYVTGHVMELRWGGFRDTESGIRHFRVGVSSAGSHGDVFPARRFRESSAILRLGHLVDGHRYRVEVTAVNGAGLMSTLTYVFMADRSLPTVGSLTTQVKSQGAARTRVTASWEGFRDSHSGLALYRAGLGTAPELPDLQPLATLGLKHTFTWDLSLRSGQQYYVIVEACNGAGLCVTSSSLPVLVDSSPPLPGTVQVGVPGRKSQYLHDRTTLTARWFNFLDPHSGISRYQWCLGTSPAQCDVTAFLDHSLMTSLLHGNLSLPVNTDLYLRVRAFNKVGLSCVGVSDRFRVDPTPPEFLSPPVFLDLYGPQRHEVRRQWEDSVLVVDWKAEDQDSPLVSQHLTVWAHGSVRLHQSLLEHGVGRLGPYVIRPDGQVRLSPGDVVRVNVTACNAAGLCRQAASPPLLVDPTPPTVGGFRQNLTWAATSTAASVSLAWYGFEDAESDIRRYHVRVGRGYSDSVLPGGTVVIDNGDGATLPLTSSIVAGDSLVLTLWAENGVGLRSGVAKVTVEVIADNVGGSRGFLSIQRHSCDPHYCTGDCTCAVVGGKCPSPSGNGSCGEVPARSEVKVTLRSAGRSGAATASSSCLQGQWSAALGAERYEWSAHLQRAPGEEDDFDHGVFAATEPVWHDVGSLTSFVHCLPSNRSLVHGRRYVADVRVWYSASSYHVFTSPSLTVDLTPPSLRRAASVSASLAHVTSSPDLRYESGSLLVAWPRLFRDSQSNVTSYDVMVGSHPGGDDVVPAVNVGSRENCSLNVTLHEGVPHHVTVVARNGVGLMTSHAAPPLLLDDEPPLPGVVFTSADYRDAHVQSDNSSVSASWHGFLDRHSSITRYQVAVVDAQSSPPSSADFRSVGMATKARRDGLSLRHGHVYRVHVRAVDSAGHVSETAVSSEIRVDATPAQAVTCRAFIRGATLVFDGNSVNHSTPIQVDLNNDHPAPIEGNSSGVTLRLTGQAMYRMTFTGHAHLLDEGAGLTLQLDPALRPAPPGHAPSTITLSPVDDEDVTVLPPREGTSWPRVVNVTRCPPSDVTASSDEDNALKITMTSPRRAHVSLHVRDPESGVEQVMLGLGTQEGGFQIQPLKPVAGHVVLLPAALPQATPLYVTAHVVNGAGLAATFTSHVVLDRTPPNVTLTDIKVIEAPGTSGGQVIVSSNWTVRDDESNVTGCAYGVGSGRGSTSLLDWLPVSPAGGRLQTLPLPGRHGDTLFLTLWCWNSLGLDTRVTSDPLPVNLRPPDGSAALVEMAADNVFSVTPEPRVQGAGGLVRMRWEGFQGGGITGYECRVSGDGGVLLDWTDVGLKNHVNVDIRQLQENSLMNLTGEVRGYNEHGQTSTSVTASLLVDTRTPNLTGGAVRANLTSESSLLLDWSDVFSLPGHQVARFTLALGRLQGASDLLPPSSVSGLTYEFPVPSQSRLRTFHVTLRATLATGVSSLYAESVHV